MKNETKQGFKPNLPIEKIVFGLGSNLGNRAKNLKTAISLLQEEFELKNLKISKILENQAMLPDKAPANWNLDFFNIAVSAQINFSKDDLIQSCEKILANVKKIEQKIGRQQRERWAPREIDIDILAVGIHQIKTQLLQIPHPGVFKRNFFIKTFQEIEPELFFNLKDLLTLN